MTTHTDLIARLREFGPCIAQDVQDALESLVQQVAALVAERAKSAEQYVARLNQIDALTKERNELEISNAFAHGEWRAVKDQLAAAQAREAKLRGVLDEAEKQLDLSQALLERSCHHHTILAAYKNVRTIREIPTDDSALMERLKEERDRCAQECDGFTHRDDKEVAEAIADAIRGLA